MNGNEQREFPFDAAESKTLCMRENSMRENREVPETPSPDGGVGRSEKAKSLKSDMYVSGNSHNLIVPTKRANKAGQQAAAESVEERGLTKGNDLVVGRVPDSGPEERVDRLEGVRQRALIAVPKYQPAAEHECRENAKRPAKLQQQMPRKPTVDLNRGRRSHRRCSHQCTAIGPDDCAIRKWPGR